MRIVTIVVLLTALSGCTRWAMNSNLDHAYRAYQEGDCDRVMLDLSRSSVKAVRAVMFSRKCRCCVASAWSGRNCMSTLRRPINS